MSEQNKKEQLVLPALRGLMGDWVYYICLMDTGNLAKRVRYAEEIHNSESLSKMIQRQLNASRSKQISEYLKQQPERFFNSLVVATYKGEPNWYPLSGLQGATAKRDLKGVSDEKIESLGFLTFSGKEELFALDGQHRLSGIKKAVKDGLDADEYDDISVIFVAHKDDEKGLERTRRLFTTLNKTARPVSKGDIIALDEDDVMAITVRRLIEESGMFSGERIAFVASNNMPVANSTSLTTIGNLYDILSILFSNANTELKKSRADLQRVRPDDDELDSYYELAVSYFTALRLHFPELRAFFAAKNTAIQVKKHRGPHGGSALFRPIGLELFTAIIANLSSDMELGEAVKRVSKLPTTLTSAPFLDLMWDTRTGTISNSHKVTLRETLLYMLGRSKLSDAELRKRYIKETGKEKASLPARLK